MIRLRKQREQGVPLTAEQLARESVQRLHLQASRPVTPSPPDWTLSLPDAVLLVIGMLASAALVWYLTDLRWRGGTAPDDPPADVEAAARQAWHLARAEQYAQQGD